MTSSSGANSLQTAKGVDWFAKRPVEVVGSRLAIDQRVDRSWCSSSSNLVALRLRRVATREWKRDKWCRFI